MPVLHPTVVQILVAFARSSPGSARLAKIDPLRFVTLGLRSQPLGMGGSVGSPARVATGIGQGVVAATPWDQQWLQPTQEP
jgi:hypothetical protein